MTFVSSCRGRSLVAVIVGAVVVTIAASACASSEDLALSPVGSWGEDAPSRPHLTFTEDGRVAGTDGCNLLRGEWEADGATIEFDLMASTRMACLDVDDWLRSVAAARIDGDTMHLRDASGAEIGTLERSTGV